MKFGIQLDLSVQRPFDAESERRAFDHALEHAVEAERQGFDFCWASEHHFLDEYAHSPAPDIVLSAIAARTSRVRLGMSALAHPVNHPAITAARAASLDVVSRGRAELAIARPATWTELSSFGGDPNADVWDETVRSLARIWAGERASLDGTHFKMQERAVVPRPYQTPHLPLWAAACDAQGEREAGALGVGLVTHALADRREQAQRIAAYKNLVTASEGVAGFVNDQVAITDLLYCHEGDAQGIEAGARLLRTAQDLAAEHVSAQELGLRGAPARPSGLAIGNPRAIIETLRNWESLGVDQVVFTLNAGEAISQAEALSSLRLLASEVMPVFDRQRTRAAAE
ncbi:MAG: LLM class flavin-dependent oxidoreductase [Alphaproteobacteria bacterium]